MTNMTLTSVAVFILSAAVLLVPASSFADKTLTISSPAGEKVITLAGDPAVTVSYTPTGMKIDFTNIAMKVVCIEDPSASGVCRLQAYDGGNVGGGNQASMPGSPGKPSLTAGDKSVTLRWTAPNNNGGAEITGYRVQIAAATSEVFANVESDTGTTDTIYTARNLINGSGYKFRVAAINSVGPGSNSPVSNIATPSESGTTQPSLIDNACDNRPQNVTCEILFDGRLDQGSKLAFRNISAGKIYSTPFIVPAAGETGGIKVTSFDVEDGFFYKIWYSATAGGDVIDPSAPVDSCEHTASYAEHTLRYTTGTESTAACSIGGQDIIYVNHAFVRESDGAYGPYSNLKIEI